jgi:hypothetical protein
MSEDPLPDDQTEADARLFAEYVERAQLLFAQRNRIYQSQFRKEGVGAVLGWIRAKVQRISVGLKGQVVDDEGLAENFLDVAVYGIIGAILSEDEQPPDKCGHLIAPGPDCTSICILCGRKLIVRVEDDHG